jgi:hypothetical protein
MAAINLRDRDGVTGRLGDVVCPVMWLHVSVYLPPITNTISPLHREKGMADILPRYSPEAIYHAAETSP